jgi:3-(3-hydroxy-phenyl)propionate hydroxylase
VLEGAAPESLIDSYHDERAFAADDNLLNSTRSTDFITPKSRASLRLRNAVLELAATEPFARPLINSGRLSTPTPYRASPLNTDDEDLFAGKMRPGTNAADAPVKLNGRDGWLLNGLGDGFTVLSFGPAPLAEVACGRVKARVLTVGQDMADVAGVLSERYDGEPGTVYLLRPDQHVAARWRLFDAGKIEAAMRRCLGLS